MDEANKTGRGQSSGGLLVIFYRFQNSGPRDEPFSSEDTLGATLRLEQCSCRQHGVVVLTLQNGEKHDLAVPETKEQACLELERLFRRYPDFPEQPDFLNAIRKAEWLPGLMPVEI